jgi:2-polyprenyl-3-methyl-5-hydroxy-6-metoxy-1,4-benzoquinol methylase
MLAHPATEEELRAFYRRQYRKKFKPALHKPSQGPGELFNIYSRFQAGRVALIKKYLTKKTRLLEIGCSAGMFLSQVKPFVKEITGIDYDRASARFAARKCNCKTYDVGVSEAGFLAHQFDVICLFQVLEHVRDPLAFLGDIKKYLTPGGRIFVEVPNLEDSLIAAYDLPNHYNFYYHAAHLWYFTRKSFLSLMKKSGFTGEVYFSQDYNFLNHMHWLSADGPQADCIAGLAEPRLPLRAGLAGCKKKALQGFISRVNGEYKELLSRLELTSNMSFIGCKE